MSELLRFNVESHDRTPAVFAEAPKSYWTPWYRAQREVNDLQQKLQAMQAERDEAMERVAEFESWREKFMEACNGNPEAWLLRKQAEAIEACETKLNKIPGAALWDLDQVQLWLDQEAGGLRQQADEIDQPGSQPNV